jgi:hypothetical protein
MYFFSHLQAGMGNTALQDKGRKPYKLRHVHPAANLGNSGRASGEPQRWGSATDRQSSATPRLTSLLSTIAESHILIFNGLLQQSSSKIKLVLQGNTDNFFRLEIIKWKKRIKLSLTKAKIKVKPSISTPRRCTEGVEVHLHSFLTSALNRDGRLTAHPSRFTPGKEPPVPIK